MWVSHILSTEVFARVAEGRGDVETKSMKGLVLVKRDMLRYLQDVLPLWERKRKG